MKGELIIEKSPYGERIAVHRLSKEKGRLIKNSNHTRDRSKGIKAYMETIKANFRNQKTISEFLEQMQIQYPRYVRDQLQILQKTIKHHEEVVEEALQVCIDKKLWSTNDLYDIADHLNRKKVYEATNETSTFRHQANHSIPRKRKRT
ncbi:hypothetical protein [Gracilibacillus lacisalsi]|uniref:hypothetical protein n=1 Tax=Gracilibacillus lacisalsi TaxID=393087 RepID=UPI000475CC78|nr:hypothetical protein [Gracilibacillus lacisalsi]